MDRLFSPSSSFARNAHTFALGNYPFQAGFEETSNANRHFGRQSILTPTNAALHVRHVSHVSPRQRASWLSAATKSCRRRARASCSGVLQEATIL